MCKGLRVVLTGLHSQKAVKHRGSVEYVIGFFDLRIAIGKYYRGEICWDMLSFYVNASIEQLYCIIAILNPKSQNIEFNYVNDIWYI